jgi:thiopurine S-methyltransferase
MDPEFWLERWRTRQVGFHQSTPHASLDRWWSTLGVPPGARVYVPLCGKSIDMVWLAAHGHSVVGSELSPLAVEEFFGELHGANVAVDAHGPFRGHRHGQFEILQGDALALTPALLGPVGAAYDRAALVALPPAMREQYVTGLAALLPAGSRTLLISFEYAQALKAGPPFSVEPAEVSRLCDPHFTVTELERNDIIAESPKFAAAGLTSLLEVTYSLTRR